MIKFNKLENTILIKYTWKELCLEFFDNNLRNYFQFYENDPSLEFYKLKK